MLSYKIRVASEGEMTKRGCQPELVEGWCAKALAAMLRRAQHDTSRASG
jgi:hypothetical protein